MSSLLTYQPGGAAVPPGIQYILDMIPPGRVVLIERFSDWLRETAPDAIDADRLAHWLAGTEQGYPAD